MYRELNEKLQSWKDSKIRIPLIIKGARQVGKTWVVREHGKTYKSFIEINLEENPELIPLFEKNYGDPNTIIRELSIFLGKDIIVGETLLFIDEIQESTKAIMSLRYFKEKLQSLHLISAGSLLEFTLKELKFPVGRVDFMYLFPLNFYEFLLAQGKANFAEEARNKDISDIIHHKLKDLVSNYILIGGMPAVVESYIQDYDLGEVQAIQQRIIQSYRHDFNKYASKANVQKLKILFDNIPRLLGEKFVYTQISENIQSKGLSIALNLMEDAGLIYRIAHSSGNGLPLSSQVNNKFFKIFFLDVGLALRILQVPLKNFILDKDLVLSNIGGVYEQFVCCELICRTPNNESLNLFYWNKEKKSSKAELDFLTSMDGKVLPIEVKAGSNRQGKSLSLFLSEKKKFVQKGVIITANKFNQSSASNIIEVTHYSIKYLRELLD